MRTLIVVLTVVAVAMAADKYVQPNILMLFSDDMGYNDVSWHDSEMITPVLDKLAHDHAVILNRSYVNQVCSQTRSALLSGFDPYHIGTSDGVYVPMETSGVPLNLTFFPDRLRKLGYRTYMCGKWHLGYCKKEYLPSSRGFDEHHGYYQGGSDNMYYHNLVRKVNGAERNGYDFWLNNKADFVSNGTYSTDVFGSSAIAYINNHKKEHPDKPWLLYMAFQNPHCPAMAPDSFVNQCKQKSEARRVYCGSMLALDTKVGEILDAIKAAGYYDNLVITFSSDNGGDSRYGASNIPLRGDKGQLFDGGTRTVTFMHSPKFLKPGVVTLNHLFHVTDWYPTYLNIAGYEVDRYADGFNQWDVLQGKSNIQRRHQFIHNIADDGAAIRYGRYKLIIGFPGNLETSLSCPTIGKAEENPNKGKPFPAPDTPEMLFDMDEDESEKNDISKTHPNIVRRLRAALDGFMREKIPSVHSLPDQLKGDPILFNNTWASGYC